MADRGAAALQNGVQPSHQVSLRRLFSSALLAPQLACTSWKNHGRARLRLPPRCLPRAAVAGCTLAARPGPLPPALQGTRRLPGLHSGGCGARGAREGGQPREQRHRRRPAGSSCACVGARRAGGAEAGSSSQAGCLGRCSRGGGAVQRCACGAGRQGKARQVWAGGGSAARSSKARQAAGQQRRRGIVSEEPRRLIICKWLAPPPLDASGLPRPGSCPSFLQPERRPARMRPSC